jgi:hypothetical protein
VEQGRVNETGESKRRRVEETESRRDGESKKRRVEETESWWNKEGSKRQKRVDGDTEADEGQRTIRVHRQSIFSQRYVVVFVTTNLIPGLTFAIQSVEESAEEDDEEE